jgi:hypothetical protein
MTERTAAGNPNARLLPDEAKNFLLRRMAYERMTAGDYRAGMASINATCRYDRTLRFGATYRGYEMGFEAVSAGSFGASPAPGPRTLSRPDRRGARGVVFRCDRARLSGMHHCARISEASRCERSIHETSY